MTHTPLCLYCAAREVAGAFTYDNGEGFCSVECNTAFHTEAEPVDEPAAGWTVPEMEYLNTSASYDDFLSQYDEPDMDIYGGQYSEE